MNWRRWDIPMCVTMLRVSRTGLMQAYQSKVTTNIDPMNFVVDVRERDARSEVRELVFS